jgi:hypothetical protein
MGYDIIRAKKDYNIRPTRDFENISGNHEAIVLFELFPAQRKSDLNAFTIQKYHKNLVTIDNRISTNVDQSTSDNLELPGEHFSKYVTKVKIYANYHFGDFVELIFVCFLNYQFKKPPKETENNLEFRKKMIEIIHKKIEENIPVEMHGFFFNNDMTIYDNEFQLPSLYIYNSNNFLFHIEETKDPDVVEMMGSTTRRRVDGFLNGFQLDREKEDSNLLLGIGLSQDRLIGVIDRALIVSFSEKFFRYAQGYAPSNYIALNFLTKWSLDENMYFRTFIFEFATMLHIDFVIKKLMMDTEHFEVPILEGAYDLTTLTQLKDKAYSLRGALNTLYDKLHRYQVDIVHDLENGLYIFSDEETLMSSFGKDWYHAHSLSDHFRAEIVDNMNSISQMLNSKKDDLSQYYQNIIFELGLKKDRPVINTMLRDVEEELVAQIIKWRGKIEQREIEEWLFNYDTKEDMLIALKILSKISYISYSDLKTLSRALHNRIKAELNGTPKSCTFSYIGDITGGSAHIVKIFQEANRLKEDLFIDNSKIKSVEKDKILLLLDDFVGFGDYFVKWFTDNIDRNQFKSIYYCVLAGFEEGIKKIIQRTGIKVIFGHQYNTSSKVLDGELFSEEEKRQIKELINKYANRLPKDFLWGRDNCQLLIALESNVPNNSLAILWASHYWTPLIERK